MQHHHLYRRRYGDTHTNLYLTPKAYEGYILSGPDMSIYEYEADDSEADNRHYVYSYGYDCDGESELMEASEINEIFEATCDEIHRMDEEDADDA